jgi:hypothetical protein
MREGVAVEIGWGDSRRGRGLSRSSTSAGDCVGGRGAIEWARDRVESGGSLIIWRIGSNWIVGRGHRNWCMGIERRVGEERGGLCGSQDSAR